MTIAVLLVEDHEVTSRGTSAFLAQFADELALVGAARAGRPGVELALQLKPDVVLMDLQLPDMHGTQATREIRAALPDTEVLCFTAFVDLDSVIAAIRAGAIGYIVKDAGPQELCDAIKAAAAGQVHLAPNIATRLFQRLPSSEMIEFLSARERIILHMLAQGQPDTAIAGTLETSEQAARETIQNVMAKLNVQSRFHAALYAVLIGLVGKQELADGNIQSVQYPFVSTLAQPGPQSEARSAAALPVLSDVQEIEDYRQRLAVLRRRLGYDLLTQAREGVMADFVLVENIRVARDQIRSIKRALRLSGQQLADHPDDDPLDSPDTSDDIGLPE
jgi:NarL family two-component system response regulator LiaR